MNIFLYQDKCKFTLQLTNGGKNEKFEIVAHIPYKLLYTNYKTFGCSRNRKTQRKGQHFLYNSKVAFTVQLDQMRRVLHGWIKKKKN